MVHTGWGETLTCASDARFGHAGLGAPWAFDHEVEITRAIGRLRHGLAGLADMNRACVAAHTNRCRRSTVAGTNNGGRSAAGPAGGTVAQVDVRAGC